MVKQMDDDWEEYYDKLEVYRRLTGEDPTNATDAPSGGAATARGHGNDNMSSLFKGGTLAVDMGASKLKLASKAPSEKPAIVVDREGARSTPSFVWISNGDVLVGRMAEGRLYDSKGGNVMRPSEILASNMKKNEAEAIKKSIRVACSNALEQTLGGQSDTKNQSTSSPLFVLDESMAYSGAYNVRPIFTYRDESSLFSYKEILQSLTSPEGIAMFVPEPIAIVTGAEYYNLLPSGSKDPVLIVDVGGLRTNISVVSNDEVLHASSIPIGGDTFVNLLANSLIRDFYGSDEDISKTIGTSTNPKLEDPSALQRLYEASTTTLHELSNKSRSRVNIPYLSIDLETKQPKHLDVEVARSIVEIEVETHIHQLVDFLENNSTVLSPSLPKPTDMSTLFSSALASTMENTSQTPQSLRAILLIGGGARIPLVRTALKRAVGLVAGDVFLERLVMPEGEMCEELAVLGAALRG